MLYLLFPALGGAIGWITNFLAIKFLFRPRQVWKLGKIRIQGVIPRRRRELSQAVGQVVATELLSREQVAAALNSTTIRTGIAAMAGQAAAGRFRSLPLLQPFPRRVREKTAEFAADMVSQEVANILSNSGPELTAEVLQSLDLAQLVEEKLDAMDWEYMESIVYSVAGRELKLIEVMGAVLGAIIGFIQALVVTFL